MQAITNIGLLGYTSAPGTRQRRRNSLAWQCVRLHLHQCPTRQLKVWETGDGRRTTRSGSALPQAKRPHLAIKMLDSCIERNGICAAGGQNDSNDEEGEGGRRRDRQSTNQLAGITLQNGPTSITWEYAPNRQLQLQNAIRSSFSTEGARGQNPESALPQAHNKQPDTDRPTVLRKVLHISRTIGKPPPRWLYLRP